MSSCVSSCDPGLLFANLWTARSIAGSCGMSKKCSVGVKPAFRALSRQLARRLLLLWFQSSTTSTPQRSICWAAPQMMSLQISAREPWPAESNDSSGYNRSIHSSKLNRTAGSTFSTCFAYVVFPTPLYPQSRCTVGLGTPAVMAPIVARRASPG